MSDLTTDDRAQLAALVGGLVGDAMSSDLVVCLRLDQTRVSLGGDEPTHVLAAVSSQFHDLTSDIPASVMPMLFRQLADELEDQLGRGQRD